MFPPKGLEIPFVTPMMVTFFTEPFGPILILLPTTSEYPKKALAVLSSIITTALPSRYSFWLKNLP